MGPWRVNEAADNRVVLGGSVLVRSTWSEWMNFGHGVLLIAKREILYDTTDQPFSHS